jgi:medium-chain acyl-[acyl-carrier-protein] hydrolase
MNPWLIYPSVAVAASGAATTTAATAAFRLFCLPYSGAGASVYRTWGTALAPNVEVVAIQLPGRESRLKEPLLHDLSMLIETLTPVLIPHLDRPFGFFGHSVGALVGFELARQLRRFDQPLPAHLFVSARHAPQLSAATAPIHQLPDVELVAQLRRYNGTPEVVLQNTELMNLFLPILRADLAMNENYMHLSEDAFEFPITAFGGLQDTQVGEDDLAAWAEQTQDTFRLQMFSGDHFFLKDHQSEILQSIVAVAKSCHTIAPS